MINISMKKFVQLDLIGIGISGVLQLVGCLTPGWVLVEYTSTYPSHIVSTYQSHSVWYRIECATENHTSCVVKYNVEKDFDTTKYLKTVTTLALVSCLAVFVLLIKMKPCPEAAMLKRLPICAYLSLLSGILWVVPAGHILDYTLNYKSDYITYHVSYSAIIAGIGGLLALLLSLFTLYFVYFKQPETNDQHPMADQQEFSLL